jgi:polysaccharide biosynthesis transport protein
VTGLAYAAVRGGLSVAIVDGDVRTRPLSERLGMANVPGLTTTVVGMAPLDDVLVELSPQLTLLPAGAVPPNPPSLLSSARMRDIVQELRDQFSLVLIDAPPVANLADPSILASHSDGIVLVARVGVTQRTDLVTAVANLRHLPTPIVGGIVLEPRDVDRTYYPAAAKGDAAVVDTAASS